MFRQGLCSETQATRRWNQVDKDHQLTGPGLSTEKAPCLRNLLCCCCSVPQSCLTLCNPTDGSTPGLPAPRHVPEFAQVHVHCISDAIQPSHPLTSSPSALSLPQHQGLFQRRTKRNLLIPRQICKVGHPIPRTTFEKTAVGPQTQSHRQPLSVHCAGSTTSPHSIFPSSPHSLTSFLCLFSQDSLLPFGP